MVYNEDMPIPKSALTVLPGHPLFQTHPDIWKDAASSLHRKNATPGDRLFMHGDAAQSLWLLIRGWVKLTRQTPDGKETLIDLCTEGDVLGEAALFQNANYPYNAEAIGTDAELVMIPAGIIRSLMAKHHVLSSHIMSLLDMRAGQATLKLEHINTLSASQRLGCFLLRLCHRDHGATMLEIPIEKQVLAAYLGIKPETLSRSQNQLKSIGVEIKGFDVNIRNVAQLREFVCNSCSQSGDCDVEDSSL